jgi:hypothetical protein
MVSDLHLNTLLNMSEYGLFSINTFVNKHYSGINSKNGVFRDQTYDLIKLWRNLPLQCLLRHVVLKFVLY